MPTAGQGLPQPDAPSLAHSERVGAALRDYLRAQGGAVSFADYMQWVLYAPGLGYYSAGARKFGDAGDFVTAPEVSPLFAQVLARQCDEVLAHLSGGVIVEFGAGTGALAATLLAALKQPERLTQYIIVEVSADLKARQAERFAGLPEALASKVTWVSEPQSLSVDGVVIANEVLDAVPTERFRIGPQSEVLQQRVAVGEDEALALEFARAPSWLAEGVHALTATHGIHLPEGYTSEWNVRADAVAGQMASVLQRGVLLIADYGYGRHAYYAPDRVDGTLTCHFRHHVHADPLVYPGIQDITAWVDFSRIAEVLDAIGMRYVGFTTQADFLMAGGLPTLFDALGDGEQRALSRGIKTLTLPGEMGERFKFLGFQRDCPVTPSGFSGRDYGRLL